MFLETKYIRLMSSCLKNFVSKGNNIFNFRCPICDDSKTNRSKARGYILFKNGQYYSYCHNCHTSHPFKKFLELVNPLLYEDFMREKYISSPQDGPIESIPQIVRKLTRENEVLLTLPKVSQLNPKHIAKRFVVSRNIPTFYHSRLYYAANFNKFADELIPDKFDPKYSEKRLVIPMLNKQKRLIGVQGRALTDIATKLRYITALCAPDNPRFFGLDLVDQMRKFYIMEGPIDSMFIPNTIAVCGGAIHSELAKHKLDLVSKNVVVVYDNEPRNKDVIRNMMKCAKRKYQIVIWPETVKAKDINDMILELVHPGKTVFTEKVQIAAEYIKSIMDANTFNGLAAESRIIEWSKVS